MSKKGEIEIIDLCDSDSDDNMQVSSSGGRSAPVEVYDADLQLALSLSREYMRSSDGGPARKKPKKENWPGTASVALNSTWGAKKPSVKSEKRRHSYPAAVASSDVAVVAPPVAPSTNFAASAPMNDDDDMVVVGSKNAVNLPHMRCHCTTHLFNHAKPHDLKHKKSCDMCYCYVCDVKVPECKKWNEHYRASDRGSQKT